MKLALEQSGPCWNYTQKKSFNIISETKKKKKSGEKN